jgi:hypothetical protein
MRSGAAAQYGLAVVLLLSEIELTRAERDETIAPAQPEPRKIKLNRNALASWPKAFQWLRKETGKPVVTTYKPKGALPIHIPRDAAYTLPELIDLFNEGLADQKLVLIQGPKSFSLVRTDRTVRNAPYVPLAELKKRGNTEIVQTLLPLKDLDAVEVAPEVRRMLGRHAVVVPLKFFNALLLQDKVSNLKAVGRMTRDDCDERHEVETFTQVCEVIRASEAERILKERLGAGHRARLPNISSDENKNMVLVQGSPEIIAMAKDIVRKLDALGPRQALSPWPVLKEYELPAAKVQGIVEMLQREFREANNVRISLAGETTILIFAREADQVEIARRIDKDPTKLRPGGVK